MGHSTSEIILMYICHFALERRVCRFPPRLLQCCRCRKGFAMPESCSVELMIGSSIGVSLVVAVPVWLRVMNSSVCSVTIGVARTSLTLIFLRYSRSLAFVCFTGHHVWDPQAEPLYILGKCARFSHGRLVESTSCETAV